MLCLQPFNFFKNETTSQVFFVCKFGMFFQPTTLLKMRRPTPEQLFFFLKFWEIFKTETSLWWDSDMGVFQRILQNFQIQTTVFLWKMLIFKTSKNLLIPWNSLLYLRKYFANQNSNYIFMITKDYSFCDQNLQSVAILDKESTIFIFFNFNSFFIPKYFTLSYYTLPLLSKDTQLIKLF